MADDHFAHSRIPIVLGVTGHRNPHPQALGPLKDAVSTIIKDLRTRYANTPLVLLSPLAEGADRMVARFALELDVQLFVPLPWPTDACPELLHRTGDRAEFDELLARASQTIPMPLVAATTGQELRTLEDCRQKHWEQVGAYVARHSQILIALWDGNDTPDGGTARVIRWQKEGKQAPFAPRAGMLDEIESGPVHHILTPRSGAEPTVVTSTIVYPRVQTGEQTAEQIVEHAKHSEEHFHAIWESLDQYNRDVTMPDAASLQNSRDWLLPRDKQAALPGPLSCLFEHYARADEAALRCQRYAGRTLQWLFGLVAGAIVSIEFYAHLVPDWWQLLATYVFLLSVAGLVHRHSRKQEHQERHLDYRALAEALRVQFFWSMGELQDSVADHYLRHFRSELDWIRQAVRTCVLVSGGHHVGPARADFDPAMRFQWIAQHWIDDQQKYFKKTAPKKYARHLQFEKLGTACFRLAVAFAAVLLAAHLYTGHMNHLLAVAVFLMAVTVAMLHEWAEKSAYVVDAQRYQWMESLFSTAQKHLKTFLAAANFPDAQELVKELGKEALSENAEWVIQHRHRPIGPPSPG